MSLQNEADMIGLSGEWVHIVHSETGGQHTATREAFETVYKPLGWELLDDPADPDAVVPSAEPPDAGEEAKAGSTSSKASESRSSSKNV